MCNSCNHNEMLQAAVDEGRTGMEAGHGGPFGAVIVGKDGKIIGRGHNRVTSSNDPTAHAEVTAIRDACKNVGHFHIPGAVLYTSCEPCPMCLAAVYWANISEVYYASDRHDAHNIGFSDNFIYEELEKPIEERSIKFIRMPEPSADALFKAWSDKQDKIPY